MQKIKIMLSIAAVVAVVGSALAFKGKSPNTFCVYQQNGTATCLLVGYSDDATVIGNGVMYVVVKIGVCAANVPNALYNEEVSYTLEQ